MTTLDSVNPADLSVTPGPEAVLPDELPGIIDDMRKTQASWAETSPKERRTLMRTLRLHIADQGERIAETVYRDTGKPRCECFSTEIMSSTAMAKYCEQLLKDFRFREKVKQGPMSLMCNFLGRKSYIEYVPYGVVAIISSYNFPLAIPFTEALMAVSAGNAVLIKPSSDTPLTGQLIQDLFEEAGFPKGLVRAVSGRGLGSAVASSDVDKIVFTGGTETGREVMRTAADRMVPAVLELGGKDAMVVLEDADLERATDCAVWSSFVNSGQVCVSTKRILLQEDIADRFTELFVSKVRKLKQGDGWNDPDVSVGPMINERQLNLMEDICTRIRDEGGEFLTGGGRRTDLRGYYFEPTVVKGLPKDSPLTDTEMFGPITCIYTFKDDDEAVRDANRCAFALGGSVWTSDIARGERVASMMRPGTVDVNNAVYTYGLPATPWGGRGMSGIGTTHAEEGFRQLMHPHHVHVDRCRFDRDGWWMPNRRGSSELMGDVNQAFFGSGKGKVSALRRFMDAMKRRSDY